MSSRVGRGWARVGGPSLHSMSCSGPRSPVWAGGRDDRAYKWLAEGQRAASGANIESAHIYEAPRGTPKRAMWGRGEAEEAGPRLAQGPAWEHRRTREPQA